jgi:PhnB protein
MKPKNYSTISPYLVVNGAEQVIDFIKEVFEATELRRYNHPDGSVMHVELRVDDSVIMLGGAGELWPAFPSMLHVYVDDVEAVYQRALDASAQPVQEPQQQEGDLDKRGGFKDPSGNIWWVATEVE